MILSYSISADFLIETKHVAASKNSLDSGLKRLFLMDDATPQSATEEMLEKKEEEMKEEGIQEIELLSESHSCSKEHGLGIDRNVPILSEGPSTTQRTVELCLVSEKGDPSAACERRSSPQQQNYSMGRPTPIPSPSGDADDDDDDDHHHHHLEGSVAVQHTGSPCFGATHSNHNNPASKDAAERMNMLSISVTDMERLQNQIIELKTINYALEEKYLDLQMKSKFVVPASFQPATLFKSLSQSVFPSSSLPSGDLGHSHPQVPPLHAPVTRQEAENVVSPSENPAILESQKAMLGEPSSSSARSIEGRDANSFVLSQTVDFQCLPPPVCGVASADASSLTPAESSTLFIAVSITRQILCACQRALTSENLQWAAEYLQQFPKSREPKQPWSNHCAFGGDGQGESSFIVSHSHLAASVSVDRDNDLALQPSSQSCIPSDHPELSSPSPSSSLSFSEAAQAAGFILSSILVTSSTPQPREPLTGASTSARENSSPSLNLPHPLIDSTRLNPVAVHPCSNSNTLSISSGAPPVLTILIPKQLELLLLKTPSSTPPPPPPSPPSPLSPPPPPFPPSPSAHGHSTEEQIQKYLKEISQQKKELEVLNEVISRQSQQLSRLTMQVTDFKTEIDDVTSLNLAEKAAFLEERFVALTELNQSLEAQLEEQQIQVAEAFEMKCVLQKLHLHLEEKENEVGKLQLELREFADLAVLLKSESQAVALSTQGSNQSRDESIDEDDETVRLVASSSNSVGRHSQDHMDERPVRECPKNDINNDKNDKIGRNLDDAGVEARDDDFEDEQKSEVSLLHRFVEHASQAELQLEIDELQSQLAMLKEELIRTQSQMEDVQSSKSKLEKRLQRDIVELKGLVRKEHEARSKAESECQRLLSLTLELNMADGGGHSSRSEAPSSTCLTTSSSSSSSSSVLNSVGCSSVVSMPTSASTSTIGLRSQLVLPPHVRLSGISVTPASDEATVREMTFNQFQEQVVALQNEIHQLRAYAKTLEEQIDQKTEMVNHLLKRWGLKEEDALSPKPSGGFFGLFQSTKGSSPLLSPRSIGRVQRVLEETLLENVRLRKDLESFCRVGM